MKFITSILILLYANQLWSCNCIYKISESESNIEIEINQSDWIGIGTITSANKKVYPIVYQLDTRILYKGSGEIRNIESGLGGMDCGFVFEVGSEYIIYGNNLNPTTIETNYCRRTNKIQDSADFDYLNRKFKDINLDLNWTESFTNFIQKKINDKIDLFNSPLVIDKEYQTISAKKVIELHPNYIVIKKINFNSGDLKRMQPKLRELVIKNGIVIVKAYGQKIKMRKLIRKLNKQIK